MPDIFSSFSRPRTVSAPIPIPQPTESHLTGTPNNCDTTQLTLYPTIYYAPVGISTTGSFDSLAQSITQQDLNTETSSFSSPLDKDGNVKSDNGISERLKGFIKQVREDKKIDLSLQKVGVEKFNDTQKLILDKLEQNEGRLSLHDKSSPEEIYKELKMSKKVFKSTIGQLFKAKIIDIQKDGINKL